MDRPTLDLTKLLPIIVVGYGYMGKIYIQQLLAMGIPPNGILVVDRIPERALASGKDYRGVASYSSMEAALALKPRTAIVLTNTPEHFSVLTALVKAGLPNIFCEKPLVLPSQLEGIRGLLAKFEGVLYTGYNIAFSPALNQLREIIDSQNLAILKIDGRWGKDRTADQRPSAGDWEDEATHVVHTALVLTRHRYHEVTFINLRAEFLRLPFVDHDAQSSLHQRDASYPLYPNSCSDVVLCIEAGDKEVVPVFVRSSFVSFEQERRIEVILGSKQGGPTHIARLDFDVKIDGKVQDRLLIRTLGSKDAPTETLFADPNKIADQLHAFLEHAAGRQRHPLLTDANEAMLMVRIANAALESNDAGQTASITV